MDKRKALRIAAICVCACVWLVCAFLLVRYALDFFRSRQISAELAAQYHAAEATLLPEATDTPLPATEVPAAAPQPDVTRLVFPATQPPVTAAPKATYDPFGGYPDNPKRLVSEQFKKLQKTNADICAWISIGAELDQAVVQRDNEYYLRRDHTGRHNNNGAIFLDEQVSLLQRPTCYILYGHNMKTEAMFGMLHKYERAEYLRANSIITFNTQYEDGQFAIFAAGTISLTPGSLRFADYYNLPNAAGSARAAILERLQKASDFRIPLEVSADDQLLILVTCVGDDAERRFVAARRLRDGESAQSLSMTYLMAEKR